MSRNKSYIVLINSMTWRRLRHDMLREHPLCQMCESEGRERFATEVHHIRPIESIDDKELQRNLAFDRDNLMCVCHECHVLAHRRLLSHANQGRRSKERASKEAIEKLFGEDPGGVFL